MHPAVLLIAVAVFLSGAFLARQSPQETPATNQNTQNTADHRMPTQEDSSPTAAPTQQPTKHLSPSPSPAPSPTPTTQQQKPAQFQSLNDFFYPNSAIISSSEQSFVLQSNDAPETITAWYEQQIEAKGYQSKAFAKTNTNGTVMNKLGAGKDNATLTIEITKKPQESATTIRVTQTKNGNTNNDVHIRIEHGEPYL